VFNNLESVKPVQQFGVFFMQNQQLTATSSAAIPTFKSKIGGQEVLCCDARTLHTFLQNQRQFADWIKQRIDQYGFEEDVDFEGFSQICEKPQGGRPATEYNLTLDMAKELSMVENNDQGKAARKYFIACEKAAISKLLPQALDQAYFERLDSEHRGIVKMLTSPTIVNKTNQIFDLKAQIKELSASLKRAEAYITNTYADQCQDS
jgi:phage anti-repressor protein